jgi:hypothetical protein
MKTAIHTYVVEVEIITDKSCKIVRWTCSARSPVAALNKLHCDIQINGLYKNIKQPISQNYTITRLAQSYRKDPLNPKSEIIESDFDLPRTNNPELNKREPRAKDSTAVTAFFDEAKSSKPAGVIL